MADGKKIKRSRDVEFSTYRRGKTVARTERVMETMSLMIFLQK